MDDIAHTTKGGAEMHETMEAVQARWREQEKKSRAEVLDLAEQMFAVLRGHDPSIAQSAQMLLGSLIAVAVAREQL